jgi:hypothetical protein
MRRLFISAILLFSLLLAVSAPAATGKVIKVLPHFLDTKGRHTTSPSLFDRDAYQAWLREHPAERSGIRYDVQWRVRAAKGPLKLRVELRGVAQGHVAKQKTLEQELKSGLWPSVTWTGVALTGEDYKNFGEITAWRVTLWDGDQLLGEQKSFLW